MRASRELSTPTRVAALALAAISCSPSAPPHHNQAATAPESSTAPKLKAFSLHGGPPDGGNLCSGKAALTGNDAGIAIQGAVGKSEPIQGTGPVSLLQIREALRAAVESQNAVNQHLGALRDESTLRVDRISWLLSARKSRAGNIRASLRGLAPADITSLDLKRLRGGECDIFEDLFEEKARKCVQAACESARAVGENRSHLWYLSHWTNDGMDDFVDVGVGFVIAPKRSKKALLVQCIWTWFER